MIPTIMLCQAFGGALGFDHVKIDDEALLRAICGDLNDRGRAKIRSLGGYSPAAFPVSRCARKKPPRS